MNTDITSEELQEEDPWRSQLQKIERELVRFHPLQFEFIDQQISRRLCIEPGERHNPDKENRRDFIKGYCSRLADHISKNKIKTTDFESMLNWLEDILL